MILHIAVPSPLYKGFDYLPADDTPRVLKPGIRVRVPFGRQTLTGILLEVRKKTDMPKDKLRTINEILDSQPILTPDLFKIALWLSDYYHYPIGETLSTVLPTLLRMDSPAELETENYWIITKAGIDLNIDSELNRAARQGAILMHLKTYPHGLSSTELEATHGKGWRAAMKALSEKGFAEKQENPLALMHHQPTPFSRLTLNSKQAEILQSLDLSSGNHKPVLLEGVTGSGKTEIYLQAIQQILDAGKQALVIVPEIGLTPQLLERFSRRFTARIVSLHSGKTDRERLNAWVLARDGQADIIIGTRSAIFTPLATPGIIIVDEEHDGSLKQQEGLRYHARDLAVLRANILKIPVILGSATPSLESMNNAFKGRYTHFTLPERAGEAVPPRIAVLDARHKPATQELTSHLITTMRSHLDKNGQVLLFLNRRGFSPVMLCHDCGWVSRCERCDAHMTFHKKRQKLHCHHCGAEQRAVQKCPECSSIELHPLGMGTERIEGALAKLFPDKTIIRIDRDSTRRKGELEKALSRMLSGDADILIGTQMLAKGHHFPNVTLVGILDIDQGLFSADFRGPETMAQLIMQVAGRAGREKRPGEVLIQTCQPDHPLLHTLIQEGYSRFAETALQERTAASLPPITHLALLRAESVKAGQALNFLYEVRDKLKSNNPTKVELLGPAPAPMEKRAGRYRAHLLIQSDQRAALHNTLTSMQNVIENLKAARQVRWSIDVDPMEMF